MTFGVLTLPNAPWDRLVGRWRELDEQGWDAVYVSDHLANPFVRGQPWLDAWSCLGAMALVVERARIGPLLTPITFRSPAAVVRAALTGDAASGGRLDLALGGGGSAHDHELAEVEPWGREERRERLERFARRVRELLDDPEVRPEPVHGAVPLVLGGHDGPLLELAAELADGWASYGGVGLSAGEGREVAAGLRVALDAACRERGRDPRSLRRTILLGHRFVAEDAFTSEEAFAEVATAWHGLGFDELVVYESPSLMTPRGVEPPPDMHARLAGSVLPDLRRTLSSDA